MNTYRKIIYFYVAWARSQQNEPSMRFKMRGTVLPYGRLISIPFTCQSCAQPMSRLNADTRDKESVADNKMRREGFASDNQSTEWCQLVQMSTIRCYCLQCETLWRAYYCRQCGNTRSKELWENNDFEHPIDNHPLRWRDSREGEDSPARQIVQMPTVLNSDWPDDFYWQQFLTRQW